MSPVSIPKIFQQTWAWSRENLNIIIGIALAIHTFPVVILTSFSTPLDPLEFSWTQFASLIVLGLFTSVLAQALLFARMRLDLFGPDAEGRRPWTLAAHYALPILLIGLVTSVLTGLGFLLLIIPGVFLAILWCVSTPALLVEDLSLAKALDRSAELTKGYRWQILGLFLIAGVILFVAGAFWEALGAVLVGGSTADAGIWFTIISQSISGFFATFFTVGQMILYRNLRGAFMGIGDEDNTIFD